MSEPFAYDVVPYPSRVFGQTHPDVMATAATYFGMSPAPPDACRVLELGCGDGSNLLSFAFALPNSEFTGIDLSEVHIKKGKHSVDEFGLANLTLSRMDL